MGRAKGGRVLKSRGLEERGAKREPLKKEAKGRGAQNDRSKRVIPKNRRLKEGAPQSKDGGVKRGGALTAVRTRPCSMGGWGG